MPNCGSTARSHTLQVGLKKLSSCSLAAITHLNPVKSTDIGAWKLLDITHKRRWKDFKMQAFYHTLDLLRLFSKG